MPGKKNLEKNIRNGVGRIHMLIEKNILILGTFHLLNAFNDVSIESFFIIHSFDVMRFLLSHFILCV